MRRERKSVVEREDEESMKNEIMILMNIRLSSNHRDTDRKQHIR